MDRSAILHLLDELRSDRSIIRNGFWADIFLRYPPYRDHLAWIRRFF